MMAIESVSFCVCVADFHPKAGKLREGTKKLHNYSDLKNALALLHS